MGAIRGLRSRQGGGQHDLARFGTKNDVQALVAALGGDSVVKGFYDTRYGITATTTVSQWDDARGAVGFGPSMVQATGANQPAWDSANKVLTTNGTTQSMASAVYAGYDLATPKWFAYIGTFSGANFPFFIMDSGGALARFFGMQGNGSVWTSSNTGNQASLLVNGTSRRLVLGGRHGAGPGVYARYLTAMAGDRIAQAGSSAPVNAIASASNLVTIGQGQTGVFAPTALRAILIGEGELTGTQANAIRAWAATNHAYVADTTKVRGMWNDGDSITAGFGVASPSTQSWPALVAASTTPFNISTSYDAMNYGIASNKLADILTMAPYLPDAAGASWRTRSLYVIMAGVNDISNGATGAAVIANLKLASSGRQAMGYKTVLVPIIPCGTLTAPQNAELATVNTWVTSGTAANFFDVVVQTTTNPVFSDFTTGAGSSANATYYQADKIHPTAAGHTEIATNATYGVVAALNASGLL